MRRIELCQAFLAGTLLAAACSSCSSADPTGGTPPGFARAKGTNVSVARPANWTAGSAPSKTMTATASSPDQGAEVDVLENLLAGASKGSKDILVDTVEAGPQMNTTGYHRTHTGPVDVKGAKAATRVDYTFTDVKKGPCQAVDVAILAPDAQIHAVRVIWRRGGLDKRTVDHIVGSIEVNG
ncbi:hypothetical protein [Actinomadura sp. DC4]|uniref:hypothetical protein n=1 Tax=Actinomadura sp. DC4 TaxID=3055069 RepID=UPI0025B18B7F|nr:hypothetical protein [Actinomadura sp. DC4]MDN3356886.1 hypothetical protein [Actinomadura sp. DC4]